MSRAAARAALAVGVLVLSACTVYPRAETVTSAPTVSFSTVPDAPEEEPVTSPTGPRWRLEEVWTGAKDAHRIQVAIVGDLVVLVTAEGEIGQVDVVDARTGATRWSTRSRALALGRDATISVDYEDSLLVVNHGGQDLLLLPYSVGRCDNATGCDIRAGGTVAIDLGSGQIVWKRVLRTVGDAEEDYLYPGFARAAGLVASTLVVDVAATSPWRLAEDNAVAGLDAGSGRERWRASGVTRPAAAGGVVVAATLAAPEPGDRAAGLSGLAGLDAASGKRLWATPLDGGR
ncbi:MAG: PQQ-binding-like beta-propeller repeat protein [Tetrasphaera sp.]